MKGLEIARDFFFSWGQPYLLPQFPDLENKIATGRLLGSEVLGDDDEISRDHSWGPQCDLFLSADDYAALGEQIAKAMGERSSQSRDLGLINGGGKVRRSIYPVLVGFLEQRVQLSLY